MKIYNLQTFYEAVGYMISAQTDTILQEQLIEKYMALPNQVWDEIISQAAGNVGVLKEVECVRQLGSILKTNVRACKSLGHVYVVQVGGNYYNIYATHYKIKSSSAASTWTC